jgi:hypothetical protein
MNVAVFWVVAPCSPVETQRRFRSACCVHLVPIYTAQHRVRNHHDTRRRENMKSPSARSIHFSFYILVYLYHFFMYRTSVASKFHLVLTVRPLLLQSSRLINVAVWSSGPFTVWHVDLISPSVRFWILKLNFKATNSLKCCWTACARKSLQATV